jgi:hypothetical protein
VGIPVLGETLKSVHNKSLRQNHFWFKFSTKKATRHLQPPPPETKRRSPQMNGQGTIFAGVNLRNGLVA